MSDERTFPDLIMLSHRERARAGEPVTDIETVHGWARLAAEAAIDVKADDVKILDMHELVSYTDYLVVATGRNVRLTRRIAEEVASRLKQRAKLVPSGTEGTTAGEWILLDYLDFVVHVFTPQARDFYRLDVLWREAPVELLGEESE